MNYNKLKAAVKKYSEQFKADPEAVKEAVNLDYEKDEAEAIIKELEAPATVKPATNSHYQWFDEFSARIQKKEVRNPYTGRFESIITGWALEKKKYSKLIEPNLAKELNSYADGYDTMSVGDYLLPKDEYKTGDLISYEDWATIQGKDLAQDKNILLTKTI